MTRERAQQALEAAGIPYRVVEHGPVRSLAEAAAARGVPPSAVIKTLVVRRAADDFVFVLVPGDRAISWSKLRPALGTNRASLPDADTALAVTGYARGTITPFGSTTAWPVICDTSVQGQVSIGAGAPGVSAMVEASDLVTALGAEVVDVTEPAPLPTPGGEG